MSWRATVGFYTQLAPLLNAGMTIGDSLASLQNHVRPPYSAWLPRLRQGVASGQALGELLHACGERQLPTALIRAGERSGKLPELCREIVAFYEHAIATRQLIIGRSIYPLCLVHAVLVIPVFPGVFLGHTHPLMLLAGPAAFWTLALILVALVSFGQRSGFGARLASLPLVRGITRPLVCGNACLVLRSAAAAGMLWPEGLRLAAGACGNRMWEQRINAVADGIEHGQISDLTAGFTQLGFSPDVIHLCSTGEKAGDLEETLGRCATLEQERFRERVNWTARIVMGVVYGLALASAALTILSMAMKVYVDPIRDAL